MVKMNCYTSTIKPVNQQLLLDLRVSQQAQKRNTWALIPQKTTWLILNCWRQTYWCQRLHMGGWIDRVSPGSEVKPGLGHASRGCKRAAVTDLWLNVLKVIQSSLQLNETDKEMFLTEPKKGKAVHPEETAGGDEGQN